MHNELQLDDVYDVWLTPFWQTPVGYAILIGVALSGLLMVYAIVSAIKARRGSTKERSLRALRALSEKVKKNQLDARRVYQELTGIIKSYAQWRYGLPRGMTDYELTTLLEAVNCDKKHQDEMRRIIADAQTVKFGRLEVLKSHVYNDIGVVISFVEVTAKSA